MLSLDGLEVQREFGLHCREKDNRCRKPVKLARDIRPRVGWSCRNAVGVGDD